MITREEDNLLQTLRMRYMDGKVGNQIKLPSGALMWYEICNGVPIKYIQWPGNQGNNKTPYIAEKWESSAEKLAFLQKYGFLMTNPEAKKYSAKFKPSSIQ